MTAALHRRLAVGIVGALVLASCGSDDVEPLESPVGLDIDEVDEILAELTDAGFCDPADVDDLGLVTAMHFVVQGQIQAPCYADGGLDDQRLLAAWDGLTSITPSELVSDVSLLAGFEPCSDCDTLAFVSALDEESSFFLMAVDVVSGDDDPNELLLTMQHELTHVFNQKPGSQLDLDVDPDSCDTYFNGTGCFTDDSYMAAWIEEFWSDDLLDELPADGAPNDDDTAADLCDAEPTFLGSYAATHPEEDFAESFSAYVFDIDVPDSLGEKMAFFDDYPEFVEIQRNAEAAGLSGLPNNFDVCG
ncbi:hypothetical protein [Ilumatobacter coccineus]|uniref:Lipoprotein n=1 Tax=Ilumatobacter coccineus (strain NBRC 103263 / KCTC 29153 / YM16-304) TaxID=1313172 RepID=A0A6C7E4P6_ILUCY|nr:hypothetical protein [Ilumatobacter coccineus]BAN01580.1 hypothetical protein YM304_12660 [Ilumatobacter coccineus YM16-304]